jgi:mannose-1-phosphate guanylyltransferase
VNTHWLSEKFCQLTNAYDITLNLIHEPSIRGVAGGVAGARHLVEAPLVVWNGDTVISEPPIERLSTVAALTGGICLAVAPSRGPGTVGLDSAGRVVRLRGETHGEEVRSADYVCLFSLGREALAELPALGCLIADYCLPRLRRGEPVYTCQADGEWWDIGSPDRYLRANRDWLSRHANHASGSFVAASATVSAGVELRGSVVGAGARVDGSGAVTGSVIWPEAHTAAPLSSCVVTPLRRLQVGSSVVP